MKILVKIILLSGLILSLAGASEQIKAIKVPGNIGKIGPLSKAWLSVEYTDVILYPHTTTKKINPEANILEENLKAKKVRVKALYDGKNISLLLEWKDSTKNTQKDCCTRTYADGFAFQFPTDYSDVMKLPYISMGSKDRSVVVHLRKASEQVSKPKSNVHFHSLEEYYDTSYTTVQDNEDVENGRTFVMEGFRSISEIKDKNASGVMDMVYKEGVWKGTLSRELKTEYLDLEKGAFPISLITWDGNVSNSDSIEYLSPWIGVKLVGERGGYELLDSLITQVDGDVANGKRLAVENCAACHNFTGSAKTLVNMAPDLSNVGGYSTLQYLKESMLDSSAVVVPNYNPTAEEDFPWYTLDENGNLASTMPSYHWMDEKSINDLVAFFSSLKVQSEE